MNAVDYEEDKKQRDRDFEELTEALSKLNSTELIVKETEERKLSIRESARRYYRKHEDILFPLFIVVILDYFFNDSRLRQKIISIAQSLLDSVYLKLAPKQLPPRGE
jgi:hypothetical protein